MKIISLKKITEFDKNLMFVFVAMLSGLFAGTVIYLKSDTAMKKSFADLFIGFHTEFSQKSLLEFFTILSTGCILFYIIMFICGASIFGKPVCALLIAFKMTGISAIITHIVLTYNIKGLEYVLLTFLPGKAFLMLSMIFACKNCFDMCEKINKIPLFKKNSESGIKLYCIKSIISYIIAVFSLFVDGLCFRLFNGILDII